MAPLAGRTAPRSLKQTASSLKEIGSIESWREVLRLCTTICNDDDVDNILEGIMTPLPEEPNISNRARSILSLMCLADEPNVNPQIVDKIMQEFIDKVVKEHELEIRKSVIEATILELIGTRWDGLVRKYLIEGFKQCNFIERENFGILLARMNIAKMKKDFVAMTEFLQKQNKRIKIGTENEKIEAALCIMEIAYESVQPIIFGRMKNLLDQLSGNEPLAYAAAGALRWLQKRGAWEPTNPEILSIIAVIKRPDADPGAIRFLTWVLADSKYDGTVEPLTFWLGHSWPALKIDVIKILGQIGNGRAIEPLLAILNDPNARVRRAIIIALTKIKSERVVEPFLAMLNDPIADVRQELVVALGQIGNERAVGPLSTMLHDPDAGVQQAVVNALGKINNELTVGPLLDRLNGANALLRRQLVVTLGQTGSERVVEPLLGMLNGADAELRRELVFALGQIGSERAVEPLLGMLNGADAELRRELVFALGQIGSERVVEPLLTLLHDADLGTQRAAVDALYYKLEKIDQILLSVDLDGVLPFIDPHELVTETRIKEAANKLFLGEEEVRARYETLAEPFRVRLSWKENLSSSKRVEH
jgi:HEAT repeat protein